MIAQLFNTNLELFREAMIIKKKIMRKYASRNREKEIEREEIMKERKRNLIPHLFNANLELFDKVILIK